GYDPRFQSMKHYVQGACQPEGCEVPVGYQAGDSVCGSVCCSGSVEQVKGMPLFAPFDGRLYLAWALPEDGSDLPPALTFKSSTCDGDPDDVEMHDGEWY